MEPTWPAGSCCQRPLIDTGLLAGVSFSGVWSGAEGTEPPQLASGQGTSPVAARRLPHGGASRISRPLGVSPPARSRPFVGSSGIEGYTDDDTAFLNNRNSLPTCSSRLSLARVRDHGCYERASFLQGRRLG